MLSMSIRRSSRARRLLALSTILCSGLAAPAWGQVSPHPNLDANGVDLTDGTFSLRLPVASIGSGQAALPLVVTGARTDNWSQMFLMRSVSGSTVTFAVSLGTGSDNFSASGGQSTRGTNATLTFSGDSATYRTLDGVVIEFGNPSTWEGGASNLCTVSSSGDCVLLATSISGKAGMTVSLNWSTDQWCSTEFNPDGTRDCNYFWRLASVSNDAGYSISWTHASNTIGPPNGSGLSAWYRRTTAVLANSNASVSSPPTVTYSYPAANTLAVTTPGGDSWTITGDYPNISAVRRPGASSDSTTISYAGGSVSSVTNNGVTTNYSRSVSGSTATVVVTDALSHTTTVVSDMNLYRPTSVTNALSQTTNFAYDSLGRPTEITAPEGNKALYAYDARGNLTSTTVRAKPGSGLADLVTAADYPTSCVDAACNSPTATRDARGNQTDYAYDTSTGLVTTVTAPAGASGVRPQMRYSYTTNTAGVTLLTGISQCQTGASCAGTADEVKSEITYDANLNPLTSTTKSGDGALVATTGYSWDGIGNLVVVDGPLPGSDDTTSIRYDADRRRIGVIAADPDGSGPRKRQASRTTYVNGQPTLAEAGTVTGTSDTDWAAFVSVQQASAIYDANGRKVRDAVTAGGTTYGVTQYSYDALGRIDCTAQRMNSSAWGSLPSSACTAQTAGAAGPDRIAQAVYDALNRVQSVTSALGTSEATTETVAYTTNGQQASVTDGEGNLTSYRYDGHDRIDRTFYPSPSTPGVSSTTDWVGWGYGAQGTLDQYRLRDGQVLIYDYDALGRTTRKRTYQIGVGVYETTDYAFDLLGRTTSLTKGSLSDGFSYDALGRMTNQSQSWGSIASQYDLAGRRTRVTWSDWFYATYDYDNTGAMTAVRENGATLLASYGYDDLGRRTSITSGNGTSTAYSFDPVSRLASLAQDVSGTGQDVTASFTHLPTGQIATVTRSNDAYAWTGAINVDLANSVNGLNQLTQSGTTALGYDARGNLTSSGSTTYAYTAENLLASTNSGLSFSYDGLGRLVEYNSSSSTWFFYDGTQMAAEVANPSSSVMRRYVWGADADEPLVWYEGSGTSDRRYLHADERGSVIAVSNASGTVTNVNSYDEYGIPASGNVGRFQYTGQAWLPELGMYYYKARIYTPTLGRFMQTDPVGYGDGLNWYNYVGGDPINFTDPSGTDGTGLGGCQTFWRNFGWRYSDGREEWYASTPLNLACISNTRTEQIFGGGGGGGPVDVTVTATKYQPKPPVGRLPQKVEPKSTWDKLKACTAAQYGFGDGNTPTGLDLGKAISELGSLPVFKPLVGIPVIGESSSFTNVLNYTSFKLGLNTRFSGAALRGFTKAAFGSVRVATVLGRANVVIGGALLAYDAASIAICTNRE